MFSDKWSLKEIQPIHSFQLEIKFTLEDNHGFVTFFVSSLKQI